MTEIDFDREGFPHERRYAAGYQVPEEDTYVRTTLLPLMRSLKESTQPQFDNMIIESYAPDTENRSHMAALLIIRTLPMEDLIEIAKSAEYWATTPDAPTV